MPSEAPPPSLRGSSPASERMLGSLLDGRYELLREMGRGGTCAVFMARHKYTARSMAVKVLLPDFKSHREARGRLLREAMMLGRVVHPNVVEILDAGEANDMPYVVMERLRAKSVEALLAARGKLTVHDTYTIGLLAADALAAVHEARVVHRDIKPGNLLVVRTPANTRTLKLIDFGAATFVEDEVSPAPTSGVIGTPEYMAPEQLAGGRVAASADIYGFGIAIYECLAGRVPFTGSLHQIFEQAQRGPRPDLRKLRPDVPASLSKLVERAIESDPAKRFENGAAIRTALVALAQDIRNETSDIAPSRRGHVRVPYPAPIEMQLTAGEVIEGRIQDVSNGGIYVTSHVRIEQGISILIRFALPTGEIVRSMAFVRWVKAGEDASRVALGLEFENLPSIFKDAIDDYIKRATM